MGHAILYCSGCSTQLREPDFEKGAAFRSDGRVYCKACAPEDVRAKAPLPERKPDMISPGTSRMMYAVPPPAGKPLPTPVLIAGGIGLLFLLLAAGLILGSGSSRPPAHDASARELVRPPETRPDTPAPPPPPRAPEPPPAPKDERPAEDALRKARDFAQSRPNDLAGQL